MEKKYIVVFTLYSQTNKPSQRMNGNLIFEKAIYITFLCLIVLFKEWVIIDNTYHIELLNLLYQSFIYSHEQHGFI